MKEEQQLQSRDGLPVLLEAAGEYGEASGSGAGERQETGAAESGRGGIFIATPAYGQLVHAEFCSSLVTTAIALRNAGYGVLWSSNALPSARFGRTELAAQFLMLNERQEQSLNLTHILWVDADIAGPLGAVEKLLAHDLPVVAGLYPRKQPRLEYPVIWSRANGDKVTVKEDSLVRASRVPGGFVLVKREVFTKLRQAYPERSLSTLWQCRPWGPWAYDLYPEALSGDGTADSEDFGFCRLWEDIGGEIWVDRTIGLTHYGSHGFYWNPEDTLGASMRLAEQEGRVVRQDERNRKAEPGEGKQGEDHGQVTGAEDIAA